MKIILYSEKCECCKNLLQYIQEINLKEYKLINIDNLSDNINIKKFKCSSLPILINNSLNKPIEGNSVYEYISNIKYFNNPTNNIEFIKNNSINNPDIKEDNKAISYNNSYLNIL